MRPSVLVSPGDVGSDGADDDDDSAAAEAEAEAVAVASRREEEELEDGGGLAIEWRGGGRFFAPDDCILRENAATSWC